MRSRTTADGWILDESTWTERSEWAIFARLDRDPIQMASVLLAFSWRRRDLHHELLSSAQRERDKRERSVSMSSGRQLSWNWLSSAYIWDCTACRSSWSTTVCETKQRAPRTEPWGTLQPTEKLDVSRPLYVNVWVRSVRYDWNHLRAMESMENPLANTDGSNWWSTVLKAALRSRMTRRDSLPLSMERTRSLWTEKRALSVEWKDR